MVVTSTPPELVQATALLLEHMNKLSTTNGASGRAQPGVLETHSDQYVANDRIVQSNDASILFEWKNDNFITEGRNERKTEPHIQMSNWSNFARSTPRRKKSGSKRKTELELDDDESPLKRTKTDFDFAPTDSELNEWFEEDRFMESFYTQMSNISGDNSPEVDASPCSSDDDFDCQFLSLADVSQDQLLQNASNNDEEDTIDDVVRIAMSQQDIFSDNSSVSSTPDTATSSPSPFDYVQKVAEPEHRLYGSANGMPLEPLTTFDVQAYAAMFSMPAPNKQLVCSGVIQRKNKKTQPGDSLQLKWKLK
jgi:hypothetical protein